MRQLFLVPNTPNRAGDNIAAKAATNTPNSAEEIASFIAEVYSGRGNDSIPVGMGSYRVGLSAESLP